MKRLRACESCSRHVFVTEQICPFCYAALAPVPERPALQPPSGLSRAQRLAFAAAAALVAPAAAVGCADEHKPGDEVAVPVYGAPIAGTQSQPAAGAAANSGSAGAAANGGRAGASGGQAVAGNVGMAVYGAPVAGASPLPHYGAPVAGQPSAGRGPIGGRGSTAGRGVDPDDDAGVADGGSDSGTMVHPVYGLPPYGSPMQKR